MVFENLSPFEENEAFDPLCWECGVECGVLVQNDLLQGCRKVR